MANDFSNDIIINYCSSTNIIDILGYSIAGRFRLVFFLLKIETE